MVLSPPEADKQIKALTPYMFKIRFCGRVARQSSAKAPTAVRIRSEPQKEIKLISFFYLDGYRNMSARES